MKNKKIIVFLIMTILFCLLIGNTEVKTNNKKLKKEIFSIDKESVSINEVIPFEWDAVYSFPPYTSKETIEEILGFESNLIIESFNEAIFGLIFVKDEEIVANPSGFPSELGYRILFPYQYQKYDGALLYEDEAIFNVEKNDGIVILKLLGISK